MEFNEFRNPEENDYDIKSNLNTNISINKAYNPYSEQLFNLVGVLEDITEEELQEQYGISMEEYFHPTEETITKVSNKLETRIHR